MKLARPDTFHPRIVLAGCPRYPAGDGDDAGLAAALRHRGLHARWLSWDDPEVAGAHLVILRATGDYPGRLDEFLALTTGAQNLLNAPAAVAWNAERRYLGDLAAGESRRSPARCSRRASGLGCRALVTSLSARRSALGRGVAVTGPRPLRHRRSARRRPRWSCSPGGRLPKRCWCSSVASRRTRSPRRATVCARPSPNSRSGMSARPRYRRQPTGWCQTR